MSDFDEIYVSEDELAEVAHNFLANMVIKNMFAGPKAVIDATYYFYLMGRLEAVEMLLEKEDGDFRKTLEEWATITRERVAELKQEAAEIKKFAKMANHATEMKLHPRGEERN